MTKQAMLAALVLGLGVWLAGGPALAQGYMTGDDPMLALPEVFVIIDSSGSMVSGSYPCGAGPAAGFCHRQFSSREVLAGTYLQTRGMCGGATVQAENGILDVYKDLVRFGVSSFDDDRCTCGNARGNYRAAWDYPAWGLGDTTGNNPTLCNSTSGSGGGKQGLAGRAAPVGWMVDLVDPANPDDILANNVRVQNSVCTVPATTCTPLNSALWDARYYHAHWRSEVSPPYVDPWATCRPRFTILFTDGQNNGPNNLYGYSSDVGEAFLSFASGIPVFVVGFGNVRPWTDPIAFAGSGGLLPSFVADNPAELFLAFSAVLDAILAGQASRTEMTSTASRSSLDKSYEFAAYFEITISGIGWTGHLIRIPVELDAGGNPVWGPAGDWIYFDQVLAAQNPNTRNIYTVVHDPRSSTFAPDQLPRPVSGTPTAGLFSFEAGRHETDDWMCLVDTEGLGLPGLSDRIKNYVRGVPGTPSVANKAIMPHPVLGDIFHSDPVIVPPPASLTPDYKYEIYFRNNVARHTMVYVGANDGMLHAFVAEDADGVGADETGRELWGFIPNQLLAKIANVRSRHDFFVDNTPVVRDVYLPNVTLTDRLGNVIKDNSNQPIKGAYRTLLFGSLRGGGSGYFALDVTEPNDPKYMWEYRPDVDVRRDYQTPASPAFAQTQCSGSKTMSFAEPVVGQVWLKDVEAVAGEPPYISKPVMLVPGGYVSPAALMNATNCIDFVEGLTFANSVHVVDVESGKLLKRFQVSNAVNAGNQALLDDYYLQLDTNPTGNWNHYGGGSAFQGDGWECGEKRDQVQFPTQIPWELMNHCTVVDTATLYEMNCCWNPGTGSGACNGTTPCHYTYRKDKTVAGGVYVFLKTEGCGLPGSNGGRFELTIDDDFMIESMAGTPVAFNPTLGEFLTRVFLPSTKGRVYRVGLDTAIYYRSGDEQERTNVANMYIQPNVTGTGTYRWDVGRVDNDPTKEPSPWFDMNRDLGLTNRPFMVPPTLAMNYERNLVLFLGSGENDTFEYRAMQEYFFGVEETQSGAVTEFRKADPIGVVDPKMRLDFRAGERMWGKPVVVGGEVYFTSYTANTNQCLPGGGSFYGLAFDDFTEDVIGGRIDVMGGGPLNPPKLIWTPAGAVMHLQTGTTVYNMPVGHGLQPTAQMMHWGRVL